MIWFAAVLVALVFALWLWLAVFPIGTGFHGKIDGEPVSCRVVVGSWFAKLVHLLRGLPKDRTAGITVLGRIHFSAAASAFLIAHEVAHCERAKRIGAYRYLWRYVTESDFRKGEEETCDELADTWQHSGYVRTIAARMPKS